MRKPLLALLFAALALPAVAADVLVPGQTRQARLESSDRPGDRGGRSHDYRLRLEQGQLVAIVVRSTDFDPVLMVFQPDGEPLAENDDHENASTNAAVVNRTGQRRLHGRVNSLPIGGDAGDYSVRAVVLDGH